MKESSNTYTGIGFTGLLQIVFIVLKLCKVITWPWLWVLSPAWISTAFIILLLVIVLIVALIQDHDSNKAKKNKLKW